MSYTPIRELKIIPIEGYRKNRDMQKAVIAIYKDGRICRFPGIREAGALMGTPHTNIVACLKGRIKTAGGCQWKYAEEVDV